MSKSNQPPSQSPGDQAPSVDVPASAPDFEENVRVFWEKNRGVLIALVVAVLVLIFGRHGWAMWQEGQAESAREAYAQAETDSARESFASAHAGTPLAGAALLEVADTAFKEGRFDAAIAGYDAAALELEGTVFGDRIRLGRAMAQMRKGDQAGGESALRAVANDTGVSASVRSEAAYHLASIALAAGNAESLNELATQIISIDATSTWAQRVGLLQASLANGADDDAASSIAAPSF